MLLINQRDEFNCSRNTVILFCIKYIVDTICRHYEFERLRLDSPSEACNIFLTKKLL